MAESPTWFADLANNVWRHPDGRTTGPTTPVVQHDVVMGVGGNPVTGTGAAGKTHVITNWDAERIYNAGQSAVNAAVNRGARVLAVTAESGTTISKTSGQASADQLDSYLNWVYYGSGSAARQNVELHWANGNEENRAQAQNGLPLATNYFNTTVLHGEVIHQTVGGERVYPLASHWIDLTEYGIRVDGHAPTWEPLGPHIDGIAMSMYPPRRQDNPCNFCGWFPGWTPNEDRWDYDFYAGVTLDWVESMHQANPNITMFATWEVASPVDGTWYGTPSAALYSVRPRYFTGGVDAHGHDHYGFLQYVYDRCDAMGVAMREQLWWDENIQYPNQFFWDSEGQIPSLPQGTARAWHDWQPGTRLPNA